MIIITVILAIILTLNEWAHISMSMTSRSRDFKKLSALFSNIPKIFV